MRKIGNNRVRPEDFHILTVPIRLSSARLFHLFANWVPR
jgi:hypothetical protein